MTRWLFKILGFKIAKRALRGRPGQTPLIDIGLGFALLRDGRVPVRSKLAALGLGGIAIAALLAMEAPVEALIALLLNVPGLGFDLMVDGLEILAGPVLAACLLLPKLVPVHIMQMVRAERGGAVPQQAYAQKERIYSPPNHLS